MHGNIVLLYAYRKCKSLTLEVHIYAYDLISHKGVTYYSNKFFKFYLNSAQSLMRGRGLNNHTGPRILRLSLISLYL